MRRVPNVFLPTSAASRLGVRLAVLVCAVVASSATLDAGPAVAVVEVASADQPTASDILRTVREAQAGRNEVLEGQLRTDDGKVLPFRLTAKGPTVRYEFPGPPAATVQVRYNEDNSQLEEVTSGGGSERLNPANFDKRVLGTDLTFEDLALRFVYWKRATLLESDDATTFASYKVKLISPSHQSQYSYVLVWVAKESGALLRAEGYDFDGKLIKRLQVVSGQKLDGKWYLKQLRIEDVEASSGKTKSRSYLDIKGLAKPVGPLPGA